MNQASERAQNWETSSALLFVVRDARFVVQQSWELDSYATQFAVGADLLTGEFALGLAVA